MQLQINTDNSDRPNPPDFTSEALPRLLSLQEGCSLSAEENLRKIEWTEKESIMGTDLRMKADKWSKKRNSKQS